MNIFAMDDGAAILLTFVALAVVILLSVLFFFLIKRNLRIERESHEIIVENAITRNQMISAIEQYIKKVDRFGALTLMYIDIDGFADLNEVFGEDTCDQILKEMATRILRILPYRASLTRFENDEFLVFIRDEDSRERIEKLADAINNIISNPYQVLVGESVAITASIGIVSYPQAGQTFNELYANLQLTTYVSKRQPDTTSSRRALESISLPVRTTCVTLSVKSASLCLRVETCPWAHRGRLRTRDRRIQLIFLIVR